MPIVATLTGMAKGISRGDAFPAALRRGPAPAPGGTTVARGPGEFVIVRHRVPLRGLAAPLTLLQVSDVHVRHATRGFEQLVNHLSGLWADVVVITGDVVAREWQLPAVLHFYAHLPQARLGRYAILGNWEHWTGWGADRLRPVLAPHGVRLLVDEGVDVGGVHLVGADDALAGHPNYDRALAGRRAGTPTVVLAHSPVAFPDLAARKVDLVLSGHTHGGQVRAGALGGPWLPKGSADYAHGWYAQDGVGMLVSAGLGWSLLPVRLGVKPEVSMIELVPAEGA